MREWTPEERWNFICDHWIKNPSLSVPEMQEVVAREFGGRMANQAMYAIRNALRQGQRPALPTTKPLPTAKVLQLVPHRDEDD